MSDQDFAVLFRNACKSYGRGSNATRVLSNLNMKVPKGSIYGLLGSSGCGKTTILGCIAGRLKLDSGELQVLGGEPGTKESGIPGPRIGYMPQDVSLVGEFNVKNMLYYFGFMFGMSSAEIAERVDFLTKLLVLPTDDRRITSLSGGQQRRVSLAAALVQTPELLLLDEPTVGLDPVLRQSIWDYMVEISRDQDMTIIITTHYIEEATQANKIGLLRNGILLADAEPHVVIAQYNCTTLEEAYLLLSSQQETQPRDTQPFAIGAGLVENAATENGGSNIARKAKEATSNGLKVSFDETSRGKRMSKRARPVATFGCRMKALLYKDFLSLIRNNAGLLFLFLFPCTEIVLFFTAVGNDADGMPLGIVNDEYVNCSQMIGHVRNSSGVLFYDDGGENDCHYHGLSCLFIDLIEDTKIVNVNYYTDVKTALAAAKKTRSQSVLHFPSNFSRMLEKRYYDADNNTNDVLDKSEIAAWVDMSNYILGHQIKQLFYETCGKFADIISDGCSVNRKLSHLPLKFNEPLFLPKHPTFRDFMAPGFLLLITFFLSAVVTGTIISSERMNGLWDRTIVAGTSAAEIVLSHILCNVVGMIAQCAEILILAFLYNLECRGNMALVIFIVGLQSFAGICFGILVGAVAPNTTAAIYCMVGSFVPYTLLTGVMWPIEAIATPFRYFTYLTPGTLACMALSNVMMKGRDLFSEFVFPGVAMTIAWIVIPYTLAVYLLRRK